MAPDPNEWLPALEAAEKYGFAYNSLRALVQAGVFTRGQFSAAEKRPPIYVRVCELEAWKKGGVPAVLPLKAAYEASLNTSVAPAGA